MKEDSNPNRKKQQPNKKVRKKKESEVEKLKIDGWAEPLQPRRPNNKPNSVQINTITTPGSMFNLMTVGCLAPPGAPSPADVSHAAVQGCAVDAGHVENHGAKETHEGVVDWEDLFGGNFEKDLDENETMYLM